MARTIKPYNVLIYCTECDNAYMYFLFPDCDHNDGHVDQAPIDDKPCDSCLKLHMRLSISDSSTKELRVWYSPTKNEITDDEETLLEMESLS